MKKDKGKAEEFSEQHLQAVEALKRSEERYALAQRAANIGSWDWDITTGELVWSERIEPMFGFAPGKFGATYEAFLDCVHPEDRQYVVDSVNACIENSKDYAIEHRIIWPDGTVRWLSETGDVVRDKTGKAIRMLGVVQDITVRKRTEEALHSAFKQSQARSAETKALLEGARAVLKNREFQDAARSIFDICKSITGATAGYVALLSKDGMENEVLFLDSGGRPCTVDPDLPMPIRGLREEAYRTGKAVYHNDFSNSEWFKFMPEGHAHLDNVLFAPLMIEDKVVGLLGLANKAGGFSEDDARMATAFGELASVALYNGRTLESLENSEERFRSVAETANDAIVSIDSSGNIILWNEGAEVIFGYSADEIIGKSVTLIMHERFHEAHKKGMRRVLSAGKSKIIGRTVELTGLRKDGSKFPLELSLASWKTDEEVFFTAIIRDITERKDIEQRQLLAGQILECLNQEVAGLEVIRHVLALIKDSTGFAAVGIRLHRGDDFPYFEAKGFSEEFIRAENYLCIRDKDGKYVLDSQGTPVLECMCGRVLSGLTIPTLPFFTEGGSFWTNSTTELLKTTIPADLKSLLRGRCNKAGYESVALIPLRSQEQIVGLLQLNDTKPGRFTPDMIRSFEGIGSSIGIALARIRAEEEIENLAKFPSENPNPVLRIAKDGTVLYANSTGSELLKDWDCEVGACVPEHWHQYTLQILKSGLSKELETVCCKDRIFSLIITPVVDAGYVNMYGIDVTERKRAEEDLRKYRQHLEELVQDRTEELTEANKQLLQEIEQRKQLEKALLDVSEREQRRIGRELHDSIGQQFTGIAFMTKVLEQKLASKLPEEAAGVEEIAKLVNQAMDQTRGLAKVLHPVDLDAGSLVSALQEFALTTENLFGIRCAFECDKPVPIDDAEVAVHLYRITQEAVTNAIKHGRAKNIHIGLTYGKKESVLTVESDGAEFPKEFEKRGTGMGLQIMDHRADIIGGFLNIRSGPKGGTIVTCAFPNERYKQ